MKKRAKEVGPKPVRTGPEIDSGSLDRLPPRSLELEHDGALLERVVKELYPELSWNQARSLIKQGKVSRAGSPERNATFPVGRGETVTVTPNRNASTQKTPTADLVVLSDSQVVVINKPAGIATVPFEDSEQNSLDKLVMKTLGRGGRPAKVHVVHRLDKETSGVLVFARTDAALKSLKSQFRHHTSSRRYVAIVHGVPRHGTLRSFLVQDRGDGLRGSTTNPSLGREAITHVRVLESFGDASLVECRLETGRTHQIRIHLSEAGHPLLGERVYIRNFSGPLLEAPRVMLHAEMLAFDHPKDGSRVEFRRDPPDDFSRVLTRFRSRS